MKESVLLGRKTKDEMGTWEVCVGVGFIGYSRNKWVVVWAEGEDLFGTIFGAEGLKDMSEENMVLFNSTVKLNIKANRFIKRKYLGVFNHFGREMLAWNVTA
uniref:Uncharacterized protein n=1 Tax=Strigamia maritima TaxID=126957 RepID=T1J8T6_STRMM